MFLFLVVCAFKTVRIVIILLTLCCSLVGVVLCFTFAHVGTEIRRGERLNQLECSLWQQVNVWWKKARKCDSRFLIDLRNFVKSLMLKKMLCLYLCYFRINDETFFFQLMVSLSSDKNCHFCEMTATAKNAQECYFSLINLSVVWINWFSCDKLYWLPSLWNDKNNKCSWVPFFYEQCECAVNKIDFLAIDCIRNRCVSPSLQVSSCSSKRVWHLHKQEELVVTLSYEFGCWRKT